MPSTPEGLRLHYTNPKFKGLPWAIDDGRKKKHKKQFRASPKQKRQHRREKNWKLRAERKLAEERCADYLVGFWQRFEFSDRKLEMLKQAACPPWKRVSDRLRKRLRSEFNRTAFHILHIEGGVQCGACDQDWAQEKHHIVPLCYGGMNDRVNILLICLACHNAIHPWMSGGTDEQHLRSK